MNTRRRLCVLGVAISGVLLSGCGSDIPSAYAPGSAAIGVRRAVEYVQTFTYLGQAQSFRVPSDVTQLSVTAIGARGGAAQGSAALGARVHAIIPVTGGELLEVYVGSAGAFEKGGFNGGGNAGANCTAQLCGYGGGGASDIRLGGEKLVDRILVAAGGGGQGGGAGESGGKGGAGGGKIGAAGQSASGAGGGDGGLGGAQTAGGLGGRGGLGAAGRGEHGAHGVWGRGGNGGERSASSSIAGGNGGGGGGGYYGGGGGGEGGAQRHAGGGGGGGSSFAEAAAFNVKISHHQVTKNGNGLVTISWE